MHRICFIDDDTVFEIPLFKDVFGDVYDVVVEDSYDGAKREIAARGEWAKRLPDLLRVVRAESVQTIESGPCKIAS